MPMQVTTPFSEAIVRKYPEQVVIVLVKEQSGRVNPITIGWTMLTSHKPPMMAFSVGLKRYSLGLLREAGECVVAFPSEEQRDAAFLFGTKTGSDTDKLKESGIAVTPAEVVDCVLLDDAVANFELKLTGEFPTGDHVIFAGEVMASHVNSGNPGRLYTVATGFKMRGIEVKS